MRGLLEFLPAHLVFEARDRRLRLEPVPGDWVAPQQQFVNRVVGEAIGVVRVGMTAGEPEPRGSPDGPQVTIGLGAAYNQVNVRVSAMPHLQIPSSSPTVRDIADVLRPLIPPGHGAVLFGSRATGRAHRGSDWDIGVVGDPPVAGAVLERIREALDALPSLDTFEVVDLAASAPEFRDAALRHTVRLI